MDISITLLSGERTIIEVSPDACVRSLYQALAALTTSAGDSSDDSTALLHGILTLEDGSPLEDMDEPLSGIDLEMGGELVMRAGKKYEALQALSELGVPGRGVARLGRRLKAEVIGGGQLEKRTAIIRHILAVGVVPGEDVFHECLRKTKLDVANLLFAAGPVPQTGLFTVLQTAVLPYSQAAACMDLIFASSTEEPTEALLASFVRAYDLKSCKKILDKGVIPKDDCFRSAASEGVCKLLCEHITQDGLDRFLSIQMTYAHGYRVIPTLLAKGAKVKTSLVIQLGSVWYEGQLKGRTPAMWSALFEAGLDGTGAVEELLKKRYFEVVKAVLQAGLKLAADMPLVFSPSFWQREHASSEEYSMRTLSMQGKASLKRRLRTLQEVLHLVIEAGADVNCVVDGATVLDGAKQFPHFASILRAEGAVTAEEVMGLKKKEAEVREEF